MSRLDELIEKLCPDGVEMHELQELFITRNGYTPSKSKSEFWENGTVPWFKMEDIRANGNILSDALQHVNECAVKGQLFPENSIIVATSATVGEHALITVPSLANQRFTYLMVKPEYEDRFMPKFLFYYCYKLDEYCLQNLNQSSFASVDMKKFAKFKFPVPPLEVQREIVHILDSFTLLTAELTAELTARKKQYEFYRDKLLSHNGIYPMKPLAELGKWSGGKTPSMSEKSFWEQGTIPWISSKDMKSSTLEDTQDHITEKAVKEASMTVYPANSIAIVTRSGILKHTFPVAYVPFETTINQDIKMLVVNEDILPRYAFHVIQGKGKDILVKTKKQGGTVDSLDFQKVLAYKVAVPSKDIQSKLVEVLDNFEAICTDLNIGLPAEIEARQKQYEYYRDLLLTFAETGSTLMTDRQTDGRTDGPIRSELSAIKLIQYVFGYAMLPLGKVANVFRGEYITKKNTKEGTIPVILGGQEPAYYIDKYNHDGEIVVVARSGASAGFVSYWNQKIFVTDGFGYEEKSELIATKFLYYVLKNTESELNDMKRGAGVPHVSGEMLNSIELPIPSLQDQQRIVEILDRFDTLCNDLSAGLPAEIKARQKQYEYYRDKLLSFKELPK